MGDFVISCSSTADLSKEFYEKNDVIVIPFHFMLGDDWYDDDCGQTISYEEFYRRMAAGEMTKTSQINVEEYTKVFEEQLKAGKDVIHFSLDSGISGTINSARIAQDTLKEEYPDRKLYVIDTLTACAGFGLLMDKVCELRDEGMNIDEIYEWVEANKMRVHTWFFPTELTYLIRGGRVSKASGMIGKMLNICPLLWVDPEGKLAVVSKLRGKKKLFRAIVDKMHDYCQDGEDYSEKAIMCNSVDEEDARIVGGMVENEFVKLKGKVDHYTVGTTIGCHTGPGTIVLAFWGIPRDEVKGSAE